MSVPIFCALSYFDLMRKILLYNQAKEDEMGKPSIMREETSSPEKSEGQRPLGRPLLRWEDNRKINRREIRWGMWTGFVWLRIGTSGGLL
jgi:hypothetical protein